MIDLSNLGLPDNRYVYHKGNKIPLTFGNKKARVNDSKTWMSYDKAKQIAESIEGGGIGYVLGNGVCAIDIDHMDTWMMGMVNMWVNKFGTYSEISMSGNGCHIIFKNDKLAINKKFTSAGIEIYTSKRYIALTGSVIDGGNGGGNGGGNSRVCEVADINDFITWAAQVDLAYKVMHKNAKFNKLWHEEGKKGNSEGDLAFCNILAGWGAGKDTIISLLRMSNRNRDKLDRDDYCEMTANKALEGVGKNKIEGCTKDKDRVSWHPEYVRLKIDEEWLTLAEFYERQSDFKMFDEFGEEVEEKVNENQFDKFVVEPVRHNVQRLMEHYGYSIKYNKMKLAYEAQKCGVGIQVEDLVVEVLDSATHQGLKIGRERLQDCILHIGRGNEYNPIKEYLDRCYLLHGSEGKSEFNKLLGTIKADCNKDMYITKFLLQMVALVMDEEAAAQFILVLQGRGGIGKTTWFRNLIPKEFRSDYFLEGRNFDLSNKDHILETISTWLTEMGEIASTFRKSDQEALKNFISSTRDKLRPPYARDSIIKKRMTSFCGTTNDIEFLTDLTGTRRFLVIPCISIDYMESINLDKLWGYVYHLLKSGEHYWITQKEIDEVVEFNRALLLKPVEILAVEEFYNLHPKDGGGFWITANELEHTIGVSKWILSRKLKQYQVRYRMSRGIVQYYVQKTEI